MPALTLRRLLIIATVALALPAATACDSYKDDVAAVQAAESIVPGKSNDALARELAARGETELLAHFKNRLTASNDPRHLELAKQLIGADNRNPFNLVLVTANIDRVGQSGTAHKIALEFINNRETRKVAFEQAFIDGKPQSLLGGALTLFLLQLD